VLAVALLTVVVIIDACYCTSLMEEFLVLSFYYVVITVNQ